MSTRRTRATAYGGMNQSFFGSGSNASAGWLPASDAFSYLWDSSPASGVGSGVLPSVPEQVSEETYVLLTELEDGDKTLVQIGNAKYYHESKTYRMVDGSVELPVSARNAEGLFVVETGRYRVMTEEEHAESKRKKAEEKRRGEILGIGVDAEESLISDLGSLSVESEAVVPPATSTTASSLLDAPLPKMTEMPVNAVLDRGAVESRAAVLPQPSKRVAAKKSSTGCGFGQTKRTVVSMGDFMGDALRLELALEKSSEVLKYASEQNNQVHLAFLGNCSPDFPRCKGKTILDVCEHIVDLKKGTVDSPVSPENVVILLGGHDLGCLRFRDRPGKSELHKLPERGNFKAGTIKLALAHLMVPAPLVQEGVLPSWARHNAELQAFASIGAWYELLEEKDLAAKADVDDLWSLCAVAQFVKLQSMAMRTKNAPGLVRNFAEAVAGGTLSSNLAGALEPSSVWQSDQDTIESIFSKYAVLDSERDRIVPTDAGRQVAVEANRVVSAVLDYMTTGPMHDYLKMAIPVDCMGQSDEAEGRGGLWLMASGTSQGLIVGKIPSSGDVVEKDGERYLEVVWRDAPVNFREAGLAVLAAGRIEQGVKVSEVPVNLKDLSGRATRLEWKMEFAEAWKKFYESFVDGKESQQLYDAWLLLSLEEPSWGPTMSVEPRPLWGLRDKTHKSAVYGSVSGVFSNPFGLLRRRLRVTASTGAHRPMEVWTATNTSGYGPSAYWAVNTWCQTVSNTLDHKIHSPVFDRSLNATDFQYDVNLTLSTLLTFEVGGRKPYERSFSSMRGVVGPCVLAGRDGGEWLRAIFWSTGVDDGGVLMLLPELYLQFMLQAYLETMQESWDDPPCTFVQGFMVLPNKDVLPIHVPGVTHAEQQQTAASMGPRIWRLSLSEFDGAADDVKYRTSAASEIQAAPPVWRDLVQFAVGEDKSEKLKPGEKVHGNGERTSFFTSTPYSDSLSGLLVRWTLATSQSNLPTITVDNETGAEETQGYFEKVF